MRPPRLATLVSLALLALFAPRSTAQTVVFSEGFEGGLASWTATGLWNSEADSDACGSGAAPFPEGSRCAYYGIDGVCDYDTGGQNSGGLTLNAPILLPTGQPALEVHWWQRADVEPCTSQSWGYDNCRLEVSANGGATWLTIAHSCLEAPPDSGATESGWWLPQRASLNAFAGQSVLLRFRFDTFDAQFNSTRGFLIDEVVVRTEAGLASCTAPCPCLLGTFGQFVGCINSAQAFGALAGGGSASVAADTLVLNATELAVPSVVLLLQAASTGASAAFGDGRFCLSGAQNRIAIRAAPAGSVSYPQPGETPISQAGLVPPAGGTRFYQVVYRDAQAWCLPSSFNATNVYRIVWVP